MKTFYIKKGLYEIQKHTVKKEMYIEKLLLEDYMKTIKNSITSRYDLISDIFEGAWEEQRENLKKNFGIEVELVED